VNDDCDDATDEGATGGDGQTCSSGACVCTTGTLCSGQCVDTTSALKGSLISRSLSRAK
jgi:hypothetical protein